MGLFLEVFVGLVFVGVGGMFSVVVKLKNVFNILVVFVNFWGVVCGWFGLKKIYVVNRGVVVLICV